MVTTLAAPASAVEPLASSEADRGEAAERPNPNRHTRIAPMTSMASAARAIADRVASIRTPS